MKNTSKILALALALVMLFAFASMFAVSAADSVRVYCDNEAGWTTVYCYYWGGSNGPSWPGKVMTYDADLDLWYYDILADHANCIFNNGSGTQSSDLKTPTDDKVVYNNSVKGWGVLGGVAEEPEKTTIYVKNTANWSKLYCYACTDGWTAETAWPGNAMTYDADLDLWYYEIMEGYVNIIFNNGSGSQTGDLKAPTDDLVVFDNTVGVWGALGGEEVYATYTIAGTGAHLGTEWDVSNTANDMVRDEETGVYTKVYENVAAGTYKFKCAENHSWNVAYPSADKSFTVETAGSTVTITLNGTTVEVTVEAPHVNSLVVGDTNKIVVSGDTVNDYNLPIEWVAFVAEENGFYSFVGDNGALAFIFTADGALVSATGAANLEAGTYLICLGNGLVGEFNVAVTKSAWVNALVEGENKILITDALVNDYGYYIVWVPFEVTEKANYTFGGDGVLALVYDAAYGSVATTELEVGTYNICVAFLTPATTGVATVNVTKTAITDTPVVEEPTLALGDNTVTIDGSEVNLTGNAVAWYTFTPEAAGTYTFACSDLTVYILTSKNMGDLNAYIGNGGVADLEAGVKYYILVGKEGITGEFTVNVSLGGEVVEKNSLAVGDNHYIVTDALIAAKAEYLYLTITEPGTYVFTGGNPMKIYVWTIPVEDLEGGALTGTTPFIWNVDVMLGDGADGVAPSFEVTFEKAGTYWVGFNYDFIGDTREFDINISLKEETSVDPVDPVDPVEPEDPEQPEDPQSEPELNFFQKILAWFMDLIQKLLAIFKK